MNTKEDNARVFHGVMAHYLESLVASRDFTGAVAYYESNRGSLDTKRDPGAASVLRLAASAYASLGKYPVALRLARTAQTEFAKQAENIDLAETFLIIGGILRDIGEMKEAEKAFHDAESVFRRNDHPEGQCRALNLIAGLLYGQADYRNSLRVLMDAVELATQLKDQEKLAYMMGNIGRIYTFSGDFDKAKEHLEINIRLSHELGHSLEEARAYRSLAYVDIQAGDFANAESALDRTGQLLATCRSPRDEAIYLSYLGEARYRAGHRDEGRDILLRALHAAEQLTDNSFLAGRILRHLGEVSVLSGEYRAAQRYVARGKAILDKIGNKVELGALYKLQAIIADADGDKNEARQQFQKALDILKEADVQFELADALARAGNSGVFSSRRRLTYLFRAEEHIQHMGNHSRLDEIERQINAVDSHRRRGSRKNEDEAAVRQEDEHAFITACPVIVQFESQLQAIARSDLPVLLTGETGVGKGHMARHFQELARPGKPFVVVSCASIPATLLESELFGYQRGAFTGADRDKPGLFTAADGGVLFLDEIGDMPLSLQAKLLGVLDSRKITPLGSSREISLDVRLVAATNKNMAQLVDEGEFRQDLYYRIGGVAFHIPPLRDRKEDIPLLLKHFIERSALNGRGKMSADLVHQFVEYDWPGNVRELHSKVKRLEVMAELVKDGDLTELSHSIFAVSEAKKDKTFFEQVERFERQLITEALLASDGNKSQAARMLGIHEATVRTKLKRYGIRAEGGAVN